MAEKPGYVNLITQGPIITKSQMISACNNYWESPHNVSTPSSACLQISVAKGQQVVRSDITIERKRLCLKVKLLLAIFNEGTHRNHVTRSV